MPKTDLTGYTDQMWLHDMLVQDTFGPVDPMGFGPALERWYYFDHDHPDFTVVPFASGIGYDGDDQYGPSTVKVTFDGKALHYHINSAKRAEIEKMVATNPRPPGYWRLFCSHLQLSIYLKEYGFPEEGIFLDTGDYPQTDMPVLAYCTNKDIDFCIIDPFFLVSHGYEHLKRDLAKQDLGFNEKQNKVFWRGSASGIKTRFDESQRYMLCSQMRDSKHREYLDLGITNTSQRLLDELAKTYGAVPDFAQPATWVSTDTFSHYRYGVDVDGNSNSWGGFFTKMLSRAYLIRVGSWGGYRQWYYSRLGEKNLFTLISPDLSDFDDALDGVFSSPTSELTEKSEGLYDFARAMDVYPEIRRNNAELHTWLKRAKV